MGNKTWGKISLGCVSFIRSKIGHLSSDSRVSDVFWGSAWALLARVFATLFNTLVMVFVARVYGADMVGIIAVLNSFFLFTAIISILGTNTSVLRLVPEYIVKHSHGAAYSIYKKINKLVILLSIIITIFLFLLSDTISRNIFFKPHLKFYFELSSLFILFYSLMRINTQTVRSLKLNKAFAVMQVLPSLSNLVLLISIHLIWSSPDIPVYAYLASFVVVSITGWHIVAKTFGQFIKGQNQVTIVGTIQIVSISFPMLMTTTMNFIIGQTGIIIMGMYENEAAVGYYSTAVKLATLTSFSLLSINSMVAPKFSELYHSKRIDDLFYVAKKSASLIFWTSTPVLLLLIIAGKPILSLFFGDNFTVAYPALVILVVGQFVSAVSGSCGHFKNMTGHQNVFRNIVFLSAIANILLNMWLIPSIGFIGAAISATFCTAFLNISLVIFIKSKFGKTTAFVPWKS